MQLQPTAAFCVSINLMSSYHLPIIFLCFFPHQTKRVEFKPIFCTGKLVQRHRTPAAVGTLEFDHNRPAFSSGRRNYCLPFGSGFLKLLRRPKRNRFPLQNRAMQCVHAIAGTFSPLPQKYTKTLGTRGLQSIFCSVTDWPCTSKLHENPRSGALARVRARIPRSQKHCRRHHHHRGKAHRRAGGSDLSMPPRPRDGWLTFWL